MEFQRDERVERRRARRRQVRRRRIAAFFVVVGVGVFAFASATNFPGLKRGGTAGASDSPRLSLPDGTQRILPDHRIVATFGIPGTGAVLGDLGVGSTNDAAERLSDIANVYNGFDAKKILPAFELIATIAHRTPSEQGLYKSRISNAQIDSLLEVAKQQGFLVILDIQPGQAKWMDEVRHYRKYLEMPNVALALDPEWSVPKGQIPGQNVIGTITAAEINEVSVYLQEIVTTKRLPQKLLIVHQFKDKQIKNREAIVERPDVALVVNVDGFGTPEAKQGKYADLTSLEREPKQFFHGFKLFFEEDVRNGSRLMDPGDVMAMDPRPDVVVYE